MFIVSSIDEWVEFDAEASQFAAARGNAGSLPFR
jgi:hypothetical protein